MMRVCCLFLFFIILPVSAALPGNTLRLHYQRQAADYDGWGLHVWGEHIELGHEITWDKPLPPKGKDAFGIYFDIPIKDDADHIFFILHKGNIKNFTKDLKWLIQSRGREIWQLEDDGTLYTSNPKSSNTSQQVLPNNPAPGARTITPAISLQTLQNAEQGRQVAEQLIQQREQELAQFQQEARRQESQAQEKIQQLNLQLQKAEQQIHSQQKGASALSNWLWQALCALILVAWAGSALWKKRLKPGTQA